MNTAERMDAIGANDDIAEYRIFGPPGTGKTTHLSRQIKRAVERYGPKAVLVTSFSKAAAATLVGRDLPVERDQIGTLHAHCYRALGRPTIAETKVADWNASHPEYAVSGGDASTMDDPGETRMAAGNHGDQLLAEASRYRNLMVPRELWNFSPLAFHDKWTEWKRKNDLMDFTDLLERAADDIHIAPGGPRVLMADEAQDFTKLQLKIVRQWGNNTEYFLVVGDDDQTIYQFTGATPDAFLQPAIDPSHKITLSQSYRVPKAIHKLATRWISGVTMREAKEYLPTAVEGEVLAARYDDTINNPKGILDSAERRMARGQTVMFLTTCSYMLGKVRSGLMDRGIPFHNPYRRARGDWNPLSCSRGVTAAERVLALLKAHTCGKGEPWTAADFRMFSDWMSSGEVFNRGAKAAIKALPDTYEVTAEDLQEWFNKDQYADLPRLLVARPGEFADWWLRRVLEAHKRPAAFPARVVALRGPQALRDQPRAIIGTIHSVKGGEADAVYIFPDLSQAGQKEWEGNALQRDTIRRLFYVGMTRARQTLVVCAASGSYGVTL